MDDFDRDVEFNEEKKHLALHVIHQVLEDYLSSG